MLHVEATFERASSDRFVVRDEAAGATRVSAIAREGNTWIAAACRSRCTIDYDVDLDALARSCRGMDCGSRFGGAFVGSAATWLLHPEPAGDAHIELRLRGGDPSRFVTGLRRAPGGGGYAFDARAMGEASYTAFGDVRVSRVPVRGASVGVALLGEPLAMGDDAASAWIRDSATCVSSLYDRFPVDATVFVLPVHDASQIVFGRVLSLAGASIALLFGRDTPAARQHEDWIAVHELFHLSTPSFVGEGHWLEEGLATYYEPILRERVGWMSEHDLWTHLALEMPRGLRSDEEPASLEERDDIDSTYWGGALFAFVADVRIRQATRGARSLDDALRAALVRIGDATHGARVADFLRVGGEATGTNVLADVHERLAVRGENVDLDALWRSLGVVVRGDAVDLDDAAPLAPVRRAIARGASPP